MSVASNVSDLVKANVSTSGTGTMTYTTALSGFILPPTSLNGKTVSYAIRDGANSETGRGTIDTTAKTITRAAISASTNAGAAISLSGAAVMAITAIALDIPGLDTDNTLAGNSDLAVPSQKAIKYYTDTSDPSFPQGRLTLTTGVPVMTSSASAQTTIYYTPYTGRWCPIYDGTKWVTTDIGGELSQATTDTTKSPAAVAASSNYDLFVWNDAGTIRCTRGPAWTSNTARGTGAGTTELQRTNGILNNKNAITNGPAAGRGTYVGTVRSNASSQIDWTLGASGTAGRLCVWNMYNRVDVKTMAADSTASWTYATATIRQANGAATTQVGFISGFAEDSIYVCYQDRIAPAGAVNANCTVAPALDSTTTMPGKTGGMRNNTTTGNLFDTVNVADVYDPQLGWHTVTGNELGDGTTTTTFQGGASQGLMFHFRM